MITGKDTNRIHLARLSVKNFFDQNCTNPLHLIIINHHPFLNVVTSETDKVDKITEIKVNKCEDFTLGDMRNLALTFVNSNELWTTWDDDDYRSNDYLTTLYTILKNKNVSAVTFTDRYEYNVNNGYVWKIHLKKGFVTMLAKKNSFQFLSLNSMEDVEIRDAYKDLYVYENKEKLLYVRLVHNNNTSKYVDANKESVKNTNSDIYSEYELSKSETIYVWPIIKEYFGPFYLTRI